ncbi:aldo/keto reductase, partial [Streptomyces sp. NPDC059083]|uniref:aldo/keto reductase n=1 Tax=Streptomyces sp. NPDC059083 TaxID=3346721 RepID=UPI0036C508CF
VIPWSPLARGRLTREPGITTTRSANDAFGATLYGGAADRAVIDAVGTVATSRGVPRAQVALAWLLVNPAISAPLVGVRTLGQLDDAVAATELTLTSDEIAMLERSYQPRPVTGI